MHRRLEMLERQVKQERAFFARRHTNAAKELNEIKLTITLANGALATIAKAPHFDDSMHLRRARCLYHLERYQESLASFQEISSRYPAAPGFKDIYRDEMPPSEKHKLDTELRERIRQYVANCPNSSHIEQVAAMAVDVLVQSGEWEEVLSSCRGLAELFPKSENLETYIFYQGVALFMKGDFKESTPLFTRFLKDYPNTERIQTVMYYLAMSYFFDNKHEETLAACKAYLDKFPDGYYAGDMHYRLSFTDFNDKKVDQSDKIIRELGEFLQNHPEDVANGSMWCLMADTYKKKKPNPKADPETQAKEIRANEDAALDAYKKALATDSLDDIIDYAFDSAVSILQKRKDWSGIAEVARMLRQKKLNS